MRNLSSQIDAWETCDEVKYRDTNCAAAPKHSYSPRFEHRRTKNPQLRNGAHRRSNKRSYM